MAGMLTVAAYICDRYEKDFGEKIDEMKLQKLMYFAQRESLIRSGKPLFQGTFYGWKYGPVLKDIREPYKEAQLPKVSPKDAAALAPVMDAVFAEFADKDSYSLCRLSLGEVSWKNSRKGIPPAENSDNAMKLADIRLDAQRIKTRRELLSGLDLL